MTTPSSPTVAVTFLPGDPRPMVTATQQPVIWLLCGANACHGFFPSLPVRSAVRPSGGAPLTPEPVRAVSGVGVVSTVAPDVPVPLVALGIGGEPMPRTAPHTVAAIDAISEGQRAINVLFLADGLVDEREMRVIRLLREAQAWMHRADWSRRARQSIENVGEINPRLEREWREIEAEFPLDAA